MLMLQIMIFVISLGASVEVHCDADKNLKGIILFFPRSGDDGGIIIQNLFV